MRGWEATKEPIQGGNNQLFFLMGHFGIIEGPD
jgi:hypothetical protein